MTDPDDHARIAQQFIEVAQERGVRIPMEFKARD